MKKVLSLVGILSLIWSAQSYGVSAGANKSAPDTLYDLQCRSFNGDWKILVSRDDQFGIVQILGSASMNGVPSSIGFSFPGSLTLQTAGFTLISDLKNSDGTVDQFSITGGRAHLSIKFLTNYQSMSPVGPANEDLVCGYL